MALPSTRPLQWNKWRITMKGFGIYKSLARIKTHAHRWQMMANVGKHMHTAAEQAFTILHLDSKKQRQSYISANTWSLLQARQTSLTQEQFNHAKDLTSKIKKAVHEDKEKQLKEQLLVGGLVAIFYFPIYWVANHPNWLSYFSEGWPNHQPD